MKQPQNSRQEGSNVLPQRTQAQCLFPRWLFSPWLSPFSGCQSNEGKTPSGVLSVGFLSSMVPNNNKISFTKPDKLPICSTVANIANNLNNNNNNQNDNNLNFVNQQNNNLNMNQNIINQLNIDLPPPVPGRRKRSGTRQNMKIDQLIN